MSNALYLDVTRLLISAGRMVLGDELLLEARVELSVTMSINGYPRISVVYS